jgi:hypothetical protein
LEIKMDTSLSKSESKWSSPAGFKDLCYIHTQDVHEYTYFNYSSTTTTSPSRRINSPTTRHPTAQALRQPRRAPRVLVSRPQRLYIDYAVRRRDIIFWAYDYLDYLPRLVSTRKLVEDGSRDINN